MLYLPPKAVVILSKARSELILGYPQQQREKGPYITTRGIISGSSTPMRKPTRPSFVFCINSLAYKLLFVADQKVPGTVACKFHKRDGICRFCPRAGD